MHQVAAVQRSKRSGNKVLDKLNGSGRMGTVSGTKASADSLPDRVKSASLEKSRPWDRANV